MSDDVRFTATDGTDLEGVLAAPPGDADRRGVAVVCHPHPQFGGSMDTWMPPVLQQALADDGWTALRFNFRGVRLSEGRFDGGRGETLDVLGAIDFLLERVGDPRAPVFLTGWSFGSLVALRAALQDDRVVGWAGVAPPVGALDLTAAAGEIALPDIDVDALAAWPRPTAWIIGTRDQFSTVGAVRQFADRATDGIVHELDGDHFLLGRGTDLSRLVVDHARRALDHHT